MGHPERTTFFYEIFDPSLPRLGPGDPSATDKALDLVLAAGLSNKDTLKILDLGCGLGAQTIQVARRTGGSITAVDTHQPYLDELTRRVRDAGVAENIRPLKADMATIEPEAGPWDLIWSEGALYLMGFRNALKRCHSLLAPGGFLAFTELTWFRPDPPRECADFFAGPCPDMAEVETNLAAIREAGFRVIDHFNLPESAWWVTYLGPIGKRIDLLRKRYGADPDRKALLDLIAKESEIYRKYSSYYGYTFYVAERI